MDATNNRDNGLVNPDAHKNRIEAILSVQLEHNSLNSRLRGQLTDSIQQLKASYNKDIEDQLKLISTLKNQVEELKASSSANHPLGLPCLALPCLALLAMLHKIVSRREIICNLANCFFCV